MSILQVFLDGKYNVGLGLANYFNAPKRAALSKANTLHDVRYTDKPFEEVCYCPPLMDFLENRYTESSLISSSYRRMKWALSKMANMEPEDCDNLTEFLTSDEVLNKFCQNLDDMSVFNKYYPNSTAYSSMSLKLITKVFAAKLGLPWTDYVDNIIDIINNFSDIDLMRNNFSYLLDIYVYRGLFLSLPGGSSFPLMRDGQLLLPELYSVVSSYSGSTVIIQEEDGIILGLHPGSSGDDNGYGVFCYPHQISFDKVNNIEIDFEVIEEMNAPRIYFGISTAKTSPTSYNANFYDSSVQESDPRKTISVDTSSYNGTYYLKFTLHDDYSDDYSDFKIKIYDIRLNKN